MVACTFKAIVVSHGHASVRHIPDKVIVGNDVAVRQFLLYVWAEMRQLMMVAWLCNCSASYVFAVGHHRQDLVHTYCTCFYTARR